MKNNFRCKYFVIRIGMLYGPYKPISIQHWSQAQPQPVNGIHVVFSVQFI